MFLAQHRKVCTCQHQALDRLGHGRDCRTLWWDSEQRRLPKELVLAEIPDYVAVNFHFTQTVLCDMNQQMAVPISQPASGDRRKQRRSEGEEREGREGREGGEGGPLVLSHLDPKEAFRRLSLHRDILTLIVHVAFQTRFKLIWLQAV